MIKYKFIWNTSAWVNGATRLNNLIITLGMQNKYPANSSCHGDEKEPQFIMIFELLLSINVMMLLNYPQTRNPISLAIDLKTKKWFLY